MESDIELLQRWWTRRDAVAFNEIATRYSGLVYAACLRVLGDASKAEDVAQECFMRLAERPAVVSISLSGWLHRVATRRALDVHRSDSRRRSREERYADTAECITSPEDLSWQEIRTYVDEAIDALPEEHRVVIVAHFLERRTHQALAADLGVSRGTVINRINKGIEQIRKHLATRGATIAETALVAVFGSRLVEAAPAGLATELGRLALAGTAGKSAAAATTPSIIGEGLVMKKAVIGAVAVLATTLSVWFAMNRPTEPPNSGRVDSGAAKQEQTSPTVSSTSSSVDTGQLASALETALGSAQAFTPAEDPVDEGAVVEGIVRNQSGTPVAGAAIYIAERPTQDDVLGKPPVTHTGTDGRFRATHVNPEVQAVFADHPDYAPGWTGIALTADGTEHVEIVLTQAGALEGTVTSGGLPQPGAFVGAWLDASGQDTLTDADGSYRIGRIPTGEWVVSLILKDADGVQREVRQSVLVSNGAVTYVDFDLSPPVGDLSGSITLRGKPVEGGYLALLVDTGRGFKEERRVPLENGGKYSILRVPEGPAELAITAITRERKHYFRSAALEILGDAPNVCDIDIQPGTGVVSGAVKLDKPAENGYIMLLAGEFNPAELSRETLLHIDSRKVGISQKPSAPYRFDELEPGTYTLLALIHPDVTAMSNTVDPLGTALIDLETVNLAEGEDLVINLTPKAVP